MRNFSVLSAIFLLFFVYAHAGKVKRQVNFDFGFGRNPQANIGDFLGGLFGQRGNTTQNPIGGLFDVLSEVATQIGITPNPNNNNSPTNQNTFQPFNFGTQIQESQGCSNNNGGCQHHCRVIHGRMRCSCNEGYHLHERDGSCHDNNECNAFRPCQERCENTEGSYRCFCSNGVLQPDGSCSSGGFSIGGGGNQGGHGHGAGTTGSLTMLSCNVLNGGCEQICTSNRNGVQCRCQPGFTVGQHPSSCVDVDECAVGLHNCPNRCINSIGSYTCHGVSFPSASPQSCASNNGGCQHRCRDTRRGIKCNCQNGMVLLSDRKSCGCPNGSIQDGNFCVGGSPNSNNQNNQKVNCDANNGGCEQRCKKGRRRGRRRNDKCRCNKKNFVLHTDKRSCVCEPGFNLDTAKNKCIIPGPTAPVVIVTEPPPPLAIDPCTVNNGGCQHTCKSSGGGGALTLRSLPKCSCKALHDLGTDGRSCIPQNPCNTKNGGCLHVCKNNNGAVSCSCQSGWKLGSDGKICTEIPKPVTSAPQRQGCGVNNKKDLLRRIVGGKPANPKDWPWMAAILRKRNSDQFCGGVLITDRHILTASHCLIDFKKEDILVRLGEYDFSSKTENSPTDFSVVDIKIHQNYNRSSQENDIAIMKLDRPSTFSEYIWPVCLPPADNNFINQLGYVTGWGSTSFGGEVSRVLQEVVVPVWNQNDCSKAYPGKVISTMMCAGLKEGGKDSCQGDSGGPYLAQIYPSSRWFVIGVVSWGIKCAAAENPGVYTRVNRYLPWIKENAVF